MRMPMIFSVSSVTLYFVVTASAQSIDWAIADDGDWGNPASWTLGNIPDTGSEHATLGLSGAYTAWSTADYTYGSLTISNPMAELWIQDGTNSVQSGITNQGLIRVGGAGSLSTLRIRSLATISGMGSILLDASSAPADARITGSFPQILHAQGHTIRGAGHIFGIFQNDGDIFADDPSGIGLELDGRYQQGVAGRLGSRQGVLRILPNVTVEGGELYTEGDGLIELPSSFSLANISVSGDLAYHGGGSGELLIESSLTNTGRIFVNADANDLGATLEFTSSYTLSGEGEVVLISGIEPFSTEIVIPPQATLTLGKGQILRGSGIINERIFTFPQQRPWLVNHGMVIADDPEHPLYIGGQIFGPGIYMADNASMIFRPRTVLEGLILDSSGEGVIQFSVAGIPLIDVINRGTLRGGPDGGSVSVQGSFQNDGLVDLGQDSEQAGGPLGLVFSTSTTISGHGTIRMYTGPDPDISSGIGIDNGSTVVVGPDQTIEGGGSVGASNNNAVLINQGTIIANNPAVPLRLEGSHVSDGGSYIADDAKIILRGGFDDVVLSSIGDGEVEIEGAICSTIEFQCDVKLVDAASGSGDLNLNELLINNGQIIVPDNTALRLADNVEIQGVGEIWLRGGSAGASSSLNTPSVVSTGQIIRGYGGLHGVEISGVGQVIADVPGESISLHNIFGGEFTTFIADGGMFRLGGPIHNITLNTVNGGSIIVTSDDGPTVESVVCNGELLIEQDGDVNIEGALEVNGETTLRNSFGLDQASIRFPMDGLLTGSGSVALDPYTVLSGAVIIAEPGARGTIDAGLLVTGSGQLLGDLVFKGELDPDLPFRRIEVDNLTLGEDSTTSLQIHGLLSSQFDRIEVINSGVLTPGGALVVVLENGYTPSITNSWDIITAPDGQLNMKGWFDEVYLPTAPDGLAYRIHQKADAAQLVLTVLADFDGNLVLDIFDILLFLEAFNRGDSIADLNGDGDFNILDILAYLDAFN